NGWFESLPAELKFKLLTMQAELGRGFIYPEELLPHQKFDDCTLKNKTILTSSLVDQMSHHEKEEILRYGVEEEEENIAGEVSQNDFVCAYILCSLCSVNPCRVRLLRCLVVPDAVR